MKDYNNQKTTLLFDDSHHPGMYFLSHLIVSKAKEVAIKNKIAPWTYHLALLMKKLIGIKLSVKDNLTDKTIQQLLGQIEKESGKAAIDGLEILKGMKLLKNTNMLPEVTNTMVTVLDGRRAEQAKRQNAGRSNANPMRLSDGLYRVKDLALLDGHVTFAYGPNEFSLPSDIREISPKHNQSCQIAISGQRVTTVSD